MNFALEIWSLRECWMRSVRQVQLKGLISGIKKGQMWPSELQVDLTSDERVGDH